MVKAFAKLQLAVVWHWTWALVSCGVQLSNVAVTQVVDVAQACEKTKCIGAVECCLAVGCVQWCSAKSCKSALFFLRVKER